MDVWEAGQTEPVEVIICSAAINASVKGPRWEAGRETHRRLWQVDEKGVKRGWPTGILRELQIRTLFGPHMCGFSKLGTLPGRGFPFGFPFPCHPEQHPLDFCALP